MCGVHPSRTFQILNESVLFVRKIERGNARSADRKLTRRCVTGSANDESKIVPTEIEDENVHVSDTLPTMTKILHSHNGNRRFRQVKEGRQVHVQDMIQQVAGVDNLTADPATVFGNDKGRGGRREGV